MLLFGEPLPLMADATIATDIDLLQELFLWDRLASFDSLPQDPRLAGCRHSYQASTRLNQIMNTAGYSAPSGSCS